MAGTKVVFEAAGVRPAGVSGRGVSGKNILAARAKVILSEILFLQKGQRALFICDQSKLPIGQAFAEGARTLGALVDAHQLKECRFDSGGLEEIIARVRTGYAVCCNFFESRAEETIFRSLLLKAQKESGALTGHSPGITEEMLTAEVDYSALKARVLKLREAFQGAEIVAITTELGTSIEIKIAGRHWFDDLDPRAKPNRMVNLPNGEIFCSPIEDGANGVIVVDGTIGDFGIVPSPLAINVRDGRILQENGNLIGIRWLNSRFKDKKNFLGRLKEKLLVDEMASVIGELGIGLIPFKTMGIILSDEKALETIHIAFGHNDGAGGKNTSQTHRDFLVRKPTLVVHYTQPNVPPRAIMENGKLLIA